MSSDRRALVVLSGGQDSVTCLFWAIDKFGPDNVEAVTFNYGQRHEVEITAAITVAGMAKVKHAVIPVGPILGGTSPLVDKARDVGQYATADALPGGLEDTFVPGRNILFLTLAANRAYCIGADHLVTGVCEEDFGGYPDCRRDFIDAMEVALRQGLMHESDPRGKVTIHTPLMTLTKKETVEMALALEDRGLPCMDALSFSHTCYNGAVPPCGKCHACHLRIKGFEDAGVPDPLMVRLEVA